MRSRDEMFDTIIDIAKENEKIRAVILNGSQANSECDIDKFSDIDIQYVVEDIESFIINKNWINVFGEILIMQEPEDWFNHPYKMKEKEPYAFLMQFTDGNRIDLTLIDKMNMDCYYKDQEPRKILLNKDSDLKLTEISESSVFNIKRPSEKEFHDIINEFHWLSLYVAKGIWREEISYAKSFYEKYEVEMIYKMLSWKIGSEKDFKISIGKEYKNFKKYLTNNEILELTSLYSDGDLKTLMKKLLYSMKYFEKIAITVGEKLKYNLDKNQMENVRNYIRMVNKESMK